MKKVGVDIGSLYLGCAVLEDGTIRDVQYLEHQGDIQGRLERLLLRPVCQGFDTIGVTGNFPQRREGIIDNTLAQIEGARMLLPGCRNVFAVGGETLTLVLFDADGSYREHSINPPCAAGTGAFIEQQAERLGLSVQELSERAAAYSGKRPVIATRCAVFAKTDIVHAMQEGFSLEAVCAGLCEGVARNVVDTLVKGREIEEPVGLIGGVSLNRAVAAALEKLLGKQVRVPEHAQTAGAVGAARLSDQTSYRPELVKREARRRQARKPLRLELSRYPDFHTFSIEVHDGVEVFLPRGQAAAGPEVYAGIDIGSTSTKAVLIDVEGRLLGGFYTATAGRPIPAVQKLIRSIMESRRGKALKILGVATTGSGRKIIKELFGADMAVNEITAHARAAVSLHPRADTIIEIGGQDSKFTLLRDGEVYFSTMNYVCAAGTGSFIEEQARRLQVSLEDFSELAFRAPAPFTSDRCTVYMERDLNALLGEGWSKEALAAAVLHSVRDNYLAKVVSKSPLGEYIVFQGATGRNRALVAAFEQLLQKPIHVSACCHLTGALGAALICREGRRDGRASSFIWEVQELKISEEVCRRCANRCLLTVVEREGRRSGWGMKCGREYDSRAPREIEPSEPERRFAQAAAALCSAAGDTAGAPSRNREERREVKIGIPQALYNVGYAPLWHNLLTRLGFTVGLSESSRLALERGKGLVNSEFCAPMILAHGYAEQLLERDFDYLFYPAVVNEQDPDSDGKLLFKDKTRDSYFCYYSQYLPTILNKLTALEVAPRLISPLLYLRQQKLEEIAGEIHREMAEKLALQIEPEEVEEAFRRAYADFSAFKKKMAGTFERLREDGDAYNPNLLILGRPYVLFDPVMNLGLPARLEQEGGRLFWQEELDLEDFQPRYSDRYYERMHWHYGQQVVKAAEYCARERNLYAVYLTCFRCSPDSFLISYVKDIMGRYDKPFLILQLDEHGSDVGYATRIEAGLESFRNHLRSQKPSRRPPKTRARDDELEHEDSVLIPHLDPVGGAFWGACFERAGYHAHLLEPDEKSLNTGYRYVNGGECMPLVSLIGAVIETVGEQRLDPRKSFFYIPTTCMACNFSNFPILADLAFESAGLKGLKIGLINSMAPGEILPPTLAVKILESNILAALIYKLFHRIRPYELEPGQSEKVVWQARDTVARAIREGRDLRQALGGVVELFGSVPRDESGGRKPRLGLLGDLYVKFNDLVNQKIQELVQELGGELVIPSFTEYPFHYYDADVRLYGDDPRHFRLLRTIEKRYEHLAGELVAEQLEPDFAECVRLMEEYGVTHYLVGETSINIGRALYYIKNNLVDAILHLNPIFCCPGVVSASIYRKIQQDFGIPIIDIFYDGAGSPNRVLIPHLHYLRESSGR